MEIIFSFEPTKFSYILMFWNMMHWLLVRSISHVRIPHMTFMKPGVHLMRRLIPPPPLFTSDHLDDWCHILLFHFQSCLEICNNGVGIALCILCGVDHVRDYSLILFCHCLLDLLYGTYYLQLQSFLVSHCICPLIDVWFMQDLALWQYWWDGAVLQSLPFLLVPSLVLCNCNNPVTSRFPCDLTSTS